MNMLGLWTVMLLAYNYARNLKLKNPLVTMINVLVVFCISACATVSTEDEISDRLLLDAAFEKLDETEKRIVTYRYYEYLTQSKTAELMNMTQVQVSRAEKKILLKLRELIK